LVNIKWLIPTIGGNILVNMNGSYILMVMMMVNDKIWLVVAANPSEK
jgi:hypothetical protein